MFDLAVPLFEAQHLFGIYRPDAQVLVLNQTLNDRWEEVGERGRLGGPPGPSHVCVCACACACVCICLAASALCSATGR